MYKGNPSCLWCTINSSLYWKHRGEHLKPFIIFCHILRNIKAKSSTQMGHFRRFFYPMFANCVHTKTMFVHVSEPEGFLSLNCSKFAAKCDWNEKNSRNVQNLGFLWKNECVLLKRNLEIFWKSLHVANFFWNASLILFFLENIFPPYFRVFLAKIRKKIQSWKS